MSGEAAEIPLFSDFGATAGIANVSTNGSVGYKDFLFETSGNGVAIFDFDGDGRNDVLIANGTTQGARQHPRPQLYRNLGGGRFRDVAGELWPAGAGWGQGVCAADYNNDGRIDVFMAHYGVNRLYRNAPTGFVDVTAAAGLPVSGWRWGAACAFLDYDRDGRLDLFVSNYVEIDPRQPPKRGSTPDCIWKGIPVACGPKGLPMARNVLYRQRSDGRFEDVSLKAGILTPGPRYGLGVVAADFNNDGWPDLYVACDQTPSLLYQNERNGTFLERGLEAGVATNNDGRMQAGMGVAVADFDGNGFLDIAKTNFSGDLPSLYLNEDGVFFRDTAQQAGLGRHQLLGWGAAFLDVDEDGQPDLIMANGHVYPEVEKAELGDRYRQPTLLYRNLGNGRFADWTAAGGPALAKPKASRGLALGDLDGDGRPEVVITNLDGPPSVLRNQGPRGHWLRITLEGTHSNRSAIGARVTVEAGDRVQLADLTSGNSYLSQHELALNFGLGAAKRVTRVTVRWPNGRIEHWRDVSADGTHHLVEGSQP